MKSKRYLLALAICGLCADPARAADKLLFGPAPDWVEQHAIEAPTDSNQAAPTRLLLMDEQVRFAPGEQTAYNHVAVKIQTPPGLQAGSLSFPWNPDTDELTIHKLAIHRGDQVIDVLASQKFTTLRREQNLEMAMLDGVLTANIQPEGLQVGDILEVETSMTTRNPVLAGHVSTDVGPLVFPVDHFRLRIQWSDAVHLRLAETDDLPAWKTTKAGGETTSEIAIDGLVPVLPPREAPLRFAISRFVDATDFKSWDQVAALFAPMYRSAAKIPADGDLRDEVERIRKSSSDPTARAEAALQLVQNRIRYLALAMGTGGLVPADAKDTWSRRYGDCKAKTALLLGILGELGIEAEPVFVNTAMGDVLPQRLPTIDLFDHVLVRAKIGGHDYWLDGTRTGDTSLARLKIPNFSWGLPLDPKAAALVRMIPAPLDQPSDDLTIHMDASKGIRIPVPTEIEQVLRGDAAIATNTALSSLVGDAREQGLRRFWQDQFDFIDVTSTSSNFDAETGELHLSMKGQAKLKWKDGWYETDGTSVGYEADFRRDDGPHKDAPFAVNYPSYTRTRETIILPPSFHGTLGRNTEIDQTVAGVAYHRHADLTDSVFTIERTSRAIAPEFPASEAAQDQAALRALYDKTVYLQIPNDYRPTEGDLAATVSAAPEDADDAITQGNQLLNAGQFDGAEAKYTRATELDPKNANAWADLGLALVDKGDNEKAKEKLAKAEALDPRNVVIYRARGMMAQKRNDYQAAVDAFTKAIEIEPKDEFSYSHRAWIQLMAGKYDLALADTAQALTLNPKNIEMYSMRVLAFNGKGDKAGAAAEIKALLAAFPDDPSALATAGQLYANLGMGDEAKALFAHALEAKPTAALYFSRSQTHAPGDLEGILTDLNEALRLDPKFEPALDARASVYLIKGQQQEALSDANRAIELNPNGERHYLLRADAFRAMGEKEKAAADFAEALRLGPTDSAAYAARSAFRYDQGDQDAALADLRKAIELAPGTVPYYLQEANYLKRMGKRDETLKVAADLVAANPQQSFAHVTAAKIYGSFDQEEQAAKEIDAALAIKPEAYIYVNKAQLRDKSDYAGRLADVDAALKLDPNSPDALQAKAQLLADQGDLAATQAIYDQQLKLDPDNTRLLIDRGIALWKQGRQDEANKDFAAARAHASSAMDLNDMCYNQAVAGAALPMALDECNESLRKSPDAPATLDSRGFVYLQLGRFDEAIADFDKALAKTPMLPTSLYGRAIAEARQGDLKSAKADLAAALKLSPSVGDVFTRSGVELPGSLKDAANVN